VRTLLCVVIGMMSSLRVVGATPDEIVSAAYPAKLSQIAAGHHYADKREQAYAAVTSSRTSYLVAAYSNGHVAAVALIDNSSASTKQVIRDHQTGAQPNVRAIDLDGDGNPEAVVTFTLGPRGGAETWIYRIQQGQLVPIGPMDEQGRSLLGSPDVVDFNGNGVMDLVDSSNVGESRDDPVIVKEHYMVRNGVYVEVAPLDFYELFFRGKAAPVTTEETFTIPADALQKSYRLTIINGGFNGEGYRASAGSVVLNGVTVASSSDFSQTRRSWTVSVPLQPSNSLSVRLEGKPSGRIIVAIRHD